MANGKQFYRRQELVSLSQLVWGLSEIDLETFVYYGTLEESGVGGPVQLDPELQARVDAEAERLRKTVPGLPTVRGSNGTI